MGVWDFWIFLKCYMAPLLSSGEAITRQLRDSHSSFYLVRGVEWGDQSKGCPSSSPGRTEFIQQGSGRPASARAAGVIVGVNPTKTYKEIGGLESEPTIKGD